MSRADTQMNTRLEGETTLPPDQILTLARETAEGLKSGGTKLEDAGVTNDGSLRLALKSTGIGYAVRGVNAAGTQGSVLVFVGDEGVEVSAAHRAVLVHLDGARTSQQTILGFIPVSAKSVVGFGLFKTYIENLATTLRVADPDGEFWVRDGDA